MVATSEFVNSLVCGRIPGKRKPLYLQQNRILWVPKTRVMILVQVSRRQTR